jgi:hypothetical protein
MPNLQITALILWLAPWIGTLLAYVLSVQAGEIAACIPHFEGCTSVSKVGRHPPGFFIFKATMLPVAGLTIVYWKLCYDWLAALGDSASRPRAMMLWLGLISSLALILYTTYLGSDGEGYRFMRRFGTVIYFGFTYLAQVLLAARIRSLAPRHANLQDIARLKLVMCALILIGGLLLAATANLFEDDDAIQNIAEWNVATMMTFYPFLTWLLWRRSNFEVRFSVGHR